MGKITEYSKSYNINGNAYYKLFLSSELRHSIKMSKNRWRQENIKNQKGKRWLDKMSELTISNINDICMNSRKHKRNTLFCQRRGFTLIEIIIVVVILAIAAMAAIPMMSSASSVQIRSAANLIAADLEYAKSMSISMGTNYRVEFDASTESYGIYKEGETTPIEHPVNVNKDYVVNFTTESRLGKVAISSVDFNSTSTVEFDCLGSPVGLSSTGSITISADGITAIITVEPVTGYVSITL